MPGGGVILAIGWPGQWSSRFIRNSGNALQVTAGQASTHFSLRPGEKVRTPLIAVLSWQGADTVRAQNLWRRWMLTHNLPGATGKPMPPLIFQCAGDFYDEMKSTAAGEITYAGKYADAGAKPDYWVIDAGWYSCGSSWFNVGTWDPDPARYPKGIKEVSDYVHSRGMKFTLWFEPERVTAGSGLANKHPEWVFGGTGGGLLNLGKSEVRNWLIGHVDSMIAKDGIDLYRQDFGLDPLTYWQNGDTAGRQGMSENLHVQGYLAYMDELRRRHPDMPIDICAAGGRRNELEDLRRAVPLLRSDYRPNATANQCQTYGLASWIPYFGTGVTMADDYAVRSSWCPALGIGVPQDVLKNGKTSWSTYKRMLAEQRQVAPYLLGDYYPLTPYSQEEHVWMAWQFDRPDLGAGMVQAFRRAGSDQECIKVRLSGLDPAGSYRVTNLDTKASKTMPGSELMGQGLLLQIGVRSGSLVITYCKSP
jgi:alpha-galactosidase